MFATTIMLEFEANSFPKKVSLMVGIIIISCLEIENYFCRTLERPITAAFNRKADFFIFYSGLAFIKWTMRKKSCLPVAH